MVESSKSGIPIINDGSPPTGVKMRTGTPDIVFSHYPFKKMWKFSMSEGQRTALIHSFRLCFRGILCPSLHISIRVWSIGYVYFWHRSFNNLLTAGRIGSTLEPELNSHLIDYQV